MTIAIGNDHAGVDYKNAITAFLKSKNIEVLNFGTDTPESVDYPDFGHAVAQALEEGKADLGIVICGSGNGIAMTANKHPHVRCAVCWTKEISALARAHNDAHRLLARRACMKGNRGNNMKKSKLIVACVPGSIFALSPSRRTRHQGKFPFPYGGSEQ